MLADVVASVVQEAARDVILMGVSFVALVWLSMVLVRMYLLWYEAAGLKTISQMMH
jgi:hypothetical protein